jgi:phosphohistidine phosphatase
MRHLFLLRHAEAHPARLGEDDHERTLTEGGRRAAAAAGDALARAPLRPSRALVSSARRARATLDEVLARLGSELPVEVERELYAADEDALLERLRLLDPSDPAVLLVGHNPALGGLARRLAGGGEPGELARLHAGFPAGALALLRFEAGSWRQVCPGRGRLLLFAPAAGD